MKVLNKSLILGLVCVGFVFATPVDNLTKEQERPVGGPIEDIINTTVTGIVQKLTDPINAEKLALSFNETMLSGSAEVSELDIYGIKKLVASKIQVNVFTFALNATISVPKVRVEATYLADVLLAELLPLYGHGDISFSIQGIEIDICGKVDLTGGLSISNVSLLFSVDKAQFDLHGLFDDEEFSALVNAVLNDNVARFIDENKVVIGSIISPIAEVLINSILHPAKNVTGVSGEEDLYSNDMYAKYFQQLEETE